MESIPGLEIGKNVRLLNPATKKKTRYKHIGKIVEMLPYFFIVDFGSYKECFKYIDVLVNGMDLIQTKVDGQWVEHKVSNPLQPTREDAVEKKRVKLSSKLYFNFGS